MGNRYPALAVLFRQHYSGSAGLDRAAKDAHDGLVGWMEHEMLAKVLRLFDRNVPPASEPRCYQFVLCFILPHIVSPKHLEALPREAR